MTPTALPGERPPGEGTLPAHLVVVGPGRVGSAFVRAAEAAGVDVAAIGRDEPHRLGDPALPAGPILVCTRADALDAVITATAPARRMDLVFVQNGMILPRLRAHGLQDATQGLVYFAATSRAGPVEPGAPSLFWGPHAAAIVAILESAGIPARVVDDREEFAREIGTKLAWNIVFGLLGERHGESVGETVARRRATVDALVTEIAPVLAAGVGAPIPASTLVRRVVDYSLGIPTFRATVKELPWRNGWLAAAAGQLGIPTPIHERLLREAGHL